MQPTATQVPVSPEEMLSQLRMGKKMSYEVTIGNLKFPMRVLSLDEEAAVRREALKRTMVLQGDETDKNIEIEKATIKLATTPIEKGGIPFISDVILSRMTADEHTQLYNEYINIRDRVNPSLEQIDPEQFKGLVECLKKNIVSKNDLSITQLRAICSAFQDLIQRLENQTSPKDS